MFRLTLGLAFRHKHVLCCISMLKFWGLCGEVLNVTKGLQRIDHLLGIKSHILVFFLAKRDQSEIVSAFQVIFATVQLICKYMCARICVFKSLQGLQGGEAYRIIFFSSVLL